MDRPSSTGRKALLLIYSALLLKMRKTLNDKLRKISSILTEVNRAIHLRPRVVHSPDCTESLLKQGDKKKKRERENWGLSLQKVKKKFKMAKFSYPLLNKYLL